MFLQKNKAYAFVLGIFLLAAWRPSVKRPISHANYAYNLFSPFVQVDKLISTMRKYPKVEKQTPKKEEHTLNKKDLTLGVIPTRRDLSGEFFCNIDIAKARKAQTEEKLRQMGIKFVNIDFLNEEGIIRNGLDAKKVATELKKQNVDALFAPHVNFGCEDAIAKTASLMDVPLLLWGPRDDSPDARGNRCTDSQCGLFATSKVLHQFGVEFSYMTNCKLDAPVFERVMNNFVSAAHVVKSVRGMRVGQFGVRPETFWSVKCNEMQLLERFGIEVVPITLIELENMYKDSLKNGPVKEKVAHYKAHFNLKVDDDYLHRMAAMQLAIRKWADAFEVDAIASSCWDAFRQIAGVAACFVFSELTEEKLPVSCETDIHGAISSVIAQAATRWQKTSFLADITALHPTDDNTELFWHCGNFPRSAARDKPHIATTFDSDLPGTGQFEMQSGAITISRFDCGDDFYQLLVAKGDVVDGPATNGKYGWVKFPDWAAIEHKVIYGPYIHHCAGTYADISPVLYEACRYIPDLHVDMANPTSQEVEAWLRG